MGCEVLGQQSVPNVARLVKEAMVMMERDRARKAKQAKANPTKAKDCFTLATTKNKGGKGKSVGSLDEASGLENISVVRKPT